MESGRQAIERRIDEVARIVGALVRREIKPGRHEIDDLIQDGVYGVLLHADSFDPKRGSLSTFATMTARHYLLGYVFVRDSYDKERVNVEAISLNQPLVRQRDGRETDKQLIDLIPSGYDLEHDVLKRIDIENMWALIDAMSDDRMRRVLKMRYGEQLVIREIGIRLGITHQRVSQLEKEGIGKLNCLMRAKKMA